MRKTNNPFFHNSPAVPVMRSKGTGGDNPELVHQFSVMTKDIADIFYSESWQVTKKP
jgi:hypothetical protein